VNAPKYVQAAALVRAQVADGTLAPGAPAPSGAALARATGFSDLTCRKALRNLMREGVLVPGASANGRPRVPAAGDHATPGAGDELTAGHALSAALASRRRAAGLTQHQLAKLAGVSVTTLGHAETGRLWQSRRFWEHADKALCADGDLLDLHDAYRAAAIPVAPVVPAETTSPGEETSAADPVPADPVPVVLATVAVALTGPVACVMVTWADGSMTTVYPPDAPVRPVGATLAAGRTGH
jgi:DNA-binding transcriptional regulator YhcF (GntR family)